MLFKIRHTGMASCQRCLVQCKNSEAGVMTRLLHGTIAGSLCTKRYSHTSGNRIVLGSLFLSALHSSGNRLSSLPVSTARLGLNTTSETSRSQSDSREHSAEVIYSSSHQGSDSRRQESRETRGGREICFVFQFIFEHFRLKSWPYLTTLHL